KADNAGILKLYAIDRLAGYYKASGKLSKANDLYRSMNCITDWAVIGPFDNPSNSGYDKVYPPEEKIDRTAEYTGRNSAPMKWFVPLSQRTDNWIDFDRSAVSTYGVHYAVTYVFSPAKQTVWVRVGTSGSVKMWLNDERILAIEDETNNGGDTYITETQLQNGWNKILMKVTSWDAGRANFLLRITDPKGNKPEGVYAENAEHSYTSKPGAQFRLIPHFAEEYFRAALKENPSHLENNLLLADVLLMNDRGEEGELVLRDALRRSPNNVMILENMMEAYIRNRKRDEVSTTLEKLSKIDSTVPSAISYKFNEALENKNFTVAESLLQTYENLMPNGENWLAMRVRLMSTRNDPKTLEVMTSGYERFPHNYFFVLGKVYSLIERKDAYGAIAIWEEYLEKHYTQDALLQIANLYSNMGRTSLWENYMKKVIELDNDESADLSRMANELYKRERYDDADEYAKRAIQQCPGASRYYNLRGDIARKLGKTNEAIALYKTAIRLAPGDFKTRAQLRELENKKPVYDLFAKMNVDSLLKSAPKAEDYPDDNSVVMLEDNKIFIHPEGAQESEYEFLIRVFNQTGIDAWKETNLGSNVDILKAVTIKANGTEIRADESGGKLVFKQMQEGDFVYMRWRGKYYSGDRFQRHVTQRHIFDGRYPYRFIRTAVLSPSENLFQYKMHNMNVQPVMTKMDDGTMFTWTMENLPTIKSEENMPAMEQIGKNVELSSVESWQFVADWYTDLTYKKWKPTYEIKEKVAEMMGGDPARLGEDEIIRRVYQFITDSIRYSFVSFRQSGYGPQKARDVLITKIGDCKDVATLGMSMLSVCGISSNYVLLDTRTNLRTKRMPSRDFDHVILRINKKSGPLYLDLTAGNFPVGSVP
ncbi:MAG: tetratricopeptide repeat protein, partial [Candidatus Kapabacteria bacterium]|nr:tetratricopeptide repeat protein [Candidatus Kapabacteria bacterium]